MTAALEQLLDSKFRALTILDMEWVRNHNTSNDSNNCIEHTAVASLLETALQCSASHEGAMVEYWIRYEELRRLHELKVDLSKTLHDSFVLTDHLTHLTDRIRYIAHRLAGVSEQDSVVDIARDINGIPVLRRRDLQEMGRSRK